VPTTAPAFLDALKAQLENRENLANVTIATAPTSFDVLESIEYGYQVRGTQAWAALGQHRRKDEYIVSGAIWVAKPGKGEAIAKQARDRAFVLMGELEEQLQSDPYVNNAVTGDIGAQLTRGDLDQWPGDQQRIARILFEITCKARI
jgi:hypothetical protein